MNKLTIDEKPFYFNIDTNNSTTIKSYNKHYEVVYNIDILEEIIINNYNNGDILIIDSKVYNLYLQHKLNTDTKYYIFNATEENKTIDSVLSIIDTMTNFTKKK